MNQPVLKVAISYQIFGQCTSVPHEFPRKIPEIPTLFDYTSYGPMAFFKTHGAVQGTENIDIGFMYSGLVASDDFSYEGGGISLLDKYDHTVNPILAKKAVETNSFMLSHFSKVLQSEIIRELLEKNQDRFGEIIDNWIVPETKISYIDRERITCSFEDTCKPVVIKPTFGSSGMGIHYFPNGISKNALLHFQNGLMRCASELRASELTPDAIKDWLVDNGHLIPGWLQRKDLTFLEQDIVKNGQIYSHIVIQERLDIVEEYRLILTFGGRIYLQRKIEDDGILRVGNEYGDIKIGFVKSGGDSPQQSYLDYPLESYLNDLNSDKSDVPKWVHDMEKVLRELLFVCPVLSIDLFKTRDGKYGVMEFAPEYSLRGSGMSNRTIQEFYHAMAYHTKDRLNLVKTNYNLNLKPLLEENHG